MDFHVGRRPEPPPRTHVVINKILCFVGGRTPVVCQMCCSGANNYKLNSKYSALWLVCVGTYEIDIMLSKPPTHALPPAAAAAELLSLFCAASSVSRRRTQRRIYYNIKALCVRLVEAKSRSTRQQFSFANFREHFMQTLNIFTWLFDRPLHHIYITMLLMVLFAHVCLSDALASPFE